MATRPPGLWVRMVGGQETRRSAHESVTGIHTDARPGLKLVGPSPELVPVLQYHVDVPMLVGQPQYTCGQGLSPDDTAAR